MSEQKYISNELLISLLNQATESELKSLTSIIEGEDFREDKPSLSPTEICQKLFGAGSYLKAVIQVATKLDVSDVPDYDSSLRGIDDLESLTTNKRKAAPKNLRYTEDSEEKIIVKVLEKTYENMSDEDKVKFDKSVQEVASQYGKSAKGLVGTAGLMVVANMGGFATYTLMSSLLSALSFGTLGFGAYTAASSLLSTLIGPVGWIGLGIYALYKLGQPNYKILIPAVVTIGAIRQRVKFEAQKKSSDITHKSIDYTDLIIGVGVLLSLILSIMVIT